jgi:hypothetical protein
MEALVYLKEKNEHYRDIEICLENVNAYPVDGFVQDIPSLNPDQLGIPPEQPTAVNEESAREETSTLDCPTAVNTILDAIQLALRENQEPGQEQAASTLQWPERAQEPASEFILGYFSKAFPDLFPNNKGDLRMTRLGKNPSLKSYFRHLLRIRRELAKHHCFVFVATNMIRRHEALSLGNVFAKKLADGLSMADLKALIAAEDDRVINKLVPFGSGIPGIHQYLSLTKLWPTSGLFASPATTLKCLHFSKLPLLPICIGLIYISSYQVQKVTWGRGWLSQTSSTVLVQKSSVGVS